MQNKLSSLAIMVITLLLSGFISISSSYADVIIREKIKYYTVTGKTGGEIYRSMLQNGPDHGNNRKDVLASTSFKFDFKNDKFKIKGNRCVLTNLDVVVDVTYTYPRWRGSRSASSATRKAWREFEKVAILHEKEHVKITEKFAGDYIKILKKSRRRTSAQCANVTGLEKIRSSFAVRKHERLHRRFDRRDLGKRGRGFKALVSLIRAK